MTGIRKRVTIGFLSIVCLLFISGMLSFLELNHLSRDTDEILRANQRNIELARQMLDAAHDQNRAFIHMAVYHDGSYDSLCRASMNRLEQTLGVARLEAHDKSFLDSLAFAATELRLLTDRFLTHFAAVQAQADLARLERADSLVRGVTDSLVASDSLTVSAAVAEPPAAVVDFNAQVDFSVQEHYDALYRRLTSAIQTYMTSTQSSLAPRTEQLKKNAYRAVTPVLISLLVMIAIVLLLYYFMLLYCVNPILKINRALGEFLQFKIPYHPKQELQDELKELSEKIETLTTLSKQPQNKL